MARRERRSQWDGTPSAEVALTQRQRRRWAFRPTPRGRFDLAGVGALWWAVLWLVLAGLLAWWLWAI